ncbi:hypothetical protein D3C85_544150 [compost metagenome]
MVQVVLEVQLAYIQRQAGGVLVVIQGPAEHPLLFGQRAGLGEAGGEEAFAVTTLGEQAAQRIVQRPPALAREHQRRVAAGRFADAEVLHPVRQRVPLHPVVDPLRHRHLLQLPALVGDQRLVQAGRWRLALEECVEVLTQCLALPGGEIARQAPVPVEVDPGLDEVRVVMLGAGQHQIGLQPLVEKVGIAAVAQLVLDAGEQARRKHGDQQLAVDATGFGFEHIALEQPITLRPGRRVGGHVADGVEHRQHGEHVALGRADGLDLVLERLDPPVHGGDVVLVGAVAGEPHQADGDEQYRRRRQRAPRQPFAPPLHVRIAADQAALAEGHIAEQPLDKVAAAGAGLPRQVLAVEVHALRHGADQPVDRAAFLGATGEVQAAQQWPFFIGIGLEHGIEEAGQAVADRRELLREAVDQVAPRRVPLLLQALHQPLGETLLEGGELRRESHQRALRALAVVQGEGGAPDLGAVFLAEVVEELHEARHQVELGEHDVDRETHSELAIQLLHPGADGLGMGGALGVAAQQQVGQADGDEGTVDGPTLALGTQQVEKAQPGGLVHGGVAVLGGVAAGGIQQHGFVGEPPVAVARTAHTANGAAAHLRGQGEVQPGIDQRGGLARAGRADDHVPGQFVQVAPLAPAQLGALEQGQRLVHALLERRQLFGRGDGGRVRRHGHQPLHDLRRIAPRLDDAQHAQADPQREHQGDQHPAHGGRGQGFVLAEGDQRTEEPDDQAEGDQAQHRHHPADEEFEESLHSAPSARMVISTRRLRARPSALALDATGSVSLRPSAVKRAGWPVRAARMSSTCWARSWESFQFDG